MNYVNTQHSCAAVLISFQTWDKKITQEAILNY